MTEKLEQPAPVPDCEMFGDWVDCWRCGGEGETFDCFDGFCADADIGCDMCTKKCDICDGKGGWEPDYDQ